MQIVAKSLKIVMANTDSWLKITSLQIQWSISVQTTWNRQQRSIHLIKLIHVSYTIPIYGWWKPGKNVSCAWYRQWHWQQSHSLAIHVWCQTRSANNSRRILAHPNTLVAMRYTFDHKKKCCNRSNATVTAIECIQKMSSVGSNNDNRNIITRYGQHLLPHPTNTKGIWNGFDGSYTSILYVNL